MRNGPKYKSREDSLERKLMAMTFWAHKEVLFDKIKEKIAKEEVEKRDEDFAERLQELLEE